MTIAAGIDLGTGAVKAVIFDVAEGAAAAANGDGINWVSRHIEKIRQRDPHKLARQAFEAAVEEAGITIDDIDYIATTGEAESLDFSTGHFYSMTTHARGGIYLEPAARAILDIGALHGRAVLIDERGKVLGYRMTSQCASGSGQFVENIARYLGITSDEIGPPFFTGGRSRKGLVDLRGAGGNGRHQHGFAADLDTQYLEGDPFIDGGKIGKAVARDQGARLHGSADGRHGE